MMRLIKEIKAFLSWRKEQEALGRIMRPLLCLELKAYTYNECLLAAGNCNGIPHEIVGVVGQILYCRCGRGNGTLKQALSLYGQGED